MLGTTDSYIQSNSSKFYNRAGKHSHRDVKGLVFKAETGLQSAELNELQDYQFQNFSDFSKTLYNNGTLTKGGMIALTFPDNNDNVSPIEINLEAAELFSEGIIVKVRGKNTLEVPRVGYFDIGILVTTMVIDENVIYKNDTEKDTLGEEDKYSLRDPAEGSRNYNEAGASRIDVFGEWVIKTVDIDIAENKEYFTIYEIMDGVLQVDNDANVAPESKAAQELVARYDSTSNGSFVLDGMITTHQDNDEDLMQHVIAISDGYARVDGHEVDFGYSQKTRIDYNLEYQLMDEESHQLSKNLDDTPVNTYSLRHNPLRDITELTYSVENDETLTYASKTHSLIKTNIQEILKVMKGNEEIAKEHYSRVNDQLVFSDDQNELTNGDSFTVYYLFKKTIYEESEIQEMINYSVNGSTVTIRDDYNGNEPIWFGVVGATTIPELEISYNFFIPRKDRIVIDKNANIIVAKGNASRLNPIAPTLFAGLSIATVEVLAGQNPIIEVEFFRAFQMSDIQRLFSRIDALEYNLAKLSLIENASAANSNFLKKSMFVDPFKNNELIDEGSIQDHLISDGMLTHARDADSIVNHSFTPDIDGYTATKDVMLAHIGTQEVVGQRFWTKTRKINEFSWNTEEIDTTVTVIPSTHNFLANGITLPTRNTVSWTGSGNSSTSSVTSAGTESVNIDQSATLPEEVAVTISSTYFDANEDVHIYFDRDVIDGNPNMIVQSDDFGRIETTYTVPVGTISGTKIFRIKGNASGVIGTSRFTLQPQATRSFTETLRRRFWRVTNDPVAETFTLDNSCFVRTIDVYFDNFPAETAENDAIPIYLFLCDTVVGFPDRNKVINKVETTIGEIRSQLEDANSVNGNYRFRFENPSYLLKDIEYCFIVDTTDNNLSVKVAEVGFRDVDNVKHINTQAYNRGVFLQSSNSSTWNPIQTEDMAFGIWAPVYLEDGTDSRTEEFILKEISVENITEFNFLASTEIFPNTNIKFEVDFNSSSHRAMQIYPYEPVIIPTFTGKLTIKATLSTGDASVSPIINKDMSLIVNKVKEESTYISKYTPVNGADDLTIYMDIIDTNVSSLIKVEYRFAYRDADDDFITSAWMPINDIEIGTSVNDNTEMILKATGIADSYQKLGNIQTKITLSANPAKISRAYIQDLRMIMV